MLRLVAHFSFQMLCPYLMRIDVEARFKDTSALNGLCFKISAFLFYFLYGK